MHSTRHKLATFFMGPRWKPGKQRLGEKTRVSDIKRFNKLTIR